MKPDPNQIRRMFDRIAARYDLLNTLISLGRHGSWKRSAETAAQVPAGGIALDVCAGTGDIARRLAQDGRSAVALDFSRPMLIRARRRNDRGAVYCVQGDALALPFPEDSFDAATIGFSLRNVASRERVFAEMARVVRPGGRVVCLETSQPGSAVLRALRRVHLAGVVALGYLLSDGAAYRYLVGSILAFPGPEEITGELRAAGLAEVQVRRLMFGAVALHVARLPEAGHAAAHPPAAGRTRRGAGEERDLAGPCDDTPHGKGGASMELFEAISSRASVRALQETEVSEADLGRILDAGRRAPSGRNRQPIEFIVVKDKATIRKLAEAQACIADVALVVLIAADPEKSEYWLEDVAAATENMLLAITALGYASVWIEGTLLRKEEQHKQVLGVPGNLRLMVALPIGEAVEGARQADKRPLADMVHWEQYGKKAG